MEVDERAPSFADILQQSVMLVSSLDEVTELPPVERNIEQIERASRDLLQRHARPGDGAALKGQYLLATHGIDPEEAKRNLDALNLKSTFEPLEPVEDTDVQSYLRHEYDMLILTAIEEAKKNTIAEFTANHTRNMANQWEAEKREILETLGRIPESADFTPDITPIATGAMDGPAAVVGRSVLNTRMLAYLRVVRALNDHKLRGHSFGVITAFREAVNRIDDMRKKEISDCFWILSSMAGEVGADANGEFSARGGLERNAYVKDYGTPSQSGRLYQRLVTGGRAFLERQYRDYITDTIARNPTAAMVGSHPTMLGNIQGFLRVVDGQTPPESEQFFWRVVYFALRCGDLTTARDFVARESSSSAGGYMSSEFARSMRDYADSNGNAVLTQKLQTMYKQARNSRSDPFKLVVLNVIGRIDDQQFDVPEGTVEDFLWFKLLMLKPDAKDMDRGPGTVDALQTTLRDYESHFRNQANPLVYFRVLLLSVQFERAVNYLAQFEQYRVEAVHFAVALNHYGLLRLPLDPHAETLCESDGLARLNLARLLISYTHSFMHTDPAEALEYYYILHDIKVHGDRSLFHVCVRDLVIETGAYDAILGSIAADGLRKPGAVDRFVRDRRELAGIVEQIASDCEERGLFHDAIALYDLADSADRVLSLLCRQLGPALALPPAPGSERDILMQVAQRIGTRLSSPTRAGSSAYGGNQLSSLIGTFRLLLDVARFFDLYNAGKFEEALQLLDHLALVPTDERELAARVDGFRSLPEEVRRNFAEILVADMTILYRLYAALKNGTYPLPLGQRRDQRLDTLRRCARLLVTFSGMIQFRLPGDTNARLVRMEVLMN